VSAVTLEKVREVAPCLPGDTEGAALLAAAVQWCEHYCGRKFDRANIDAERGRTVRDDAPGEPRHYVYLARPPVQAVTSVFLDEAGIDGSLFEVISDGGRAERLLIKTYEDVPGYATRVSYTGGWEDGAAPAGLVLAVATLMGRLRDRAQQGAVGSESSGGESASYLSAGQLYEDIRVMLRPYRLMRL